MTRAIKVILVQAINQLISNFKLKVAKVTPLPSIHYIYEERSAAAAVYTNAYNLISESFTKFIRNKTHKL